MTTPRAAERTRRSRLRARVGRLDPARLLPAEAVAHLRKASREELLAVRSLLDALIARLEREERVRS